MATTWTNGDVSGSQTLTDNDHLYPGHINELRTVAGAEHNSDGTHDTTKIGMLAGTQTFTGDKTFTTPLTVAGTSVGPAELRLKEDTDNGANYVSLKAPSALSADKTYVLPSADGSAGQFLKTDGSGNLSFDTPSIIIADASVTNRKMKFDEIQTATISSTSTSSTSYTDMTGSSITFTPSVACNLLVFVELNWYNSGTGTNSAIIDLGGVTKGADPKLQYDSSSANKAITMSSTLWITGVSASSQTLKLRYKASANTAAINAGYILIIPIAS